MTGITPQGFVGLRLPEIKANIEQRLTTAFGQIDLREESIFGQQVGIHSELDAILWQLAEDVYNSQYPDTASGISLDYAVSLNNVTRIPATPTTVSAVVYGLRGTVLPVGREASNPSTGDVYRTSQAVTISLTNAVYAAISVVAAAEQPYTITINSVPYTYTGEPGDTAQDILQGLFTALSSSAVVTRTIVTGSLRLAAVSASAAITITTNLTATEVGTPASFAAIDTGAKLLPVGALSRIETPVSGWARVTNLVEGETGTDRETDGELRIRREQSIQLTATNTLDAIVSRLLQIAGVTDQSVLQNTGTTTDPDGTPPQHVWAVVEGGDDNEIAQVLFEAVAGGIGLRGAQEVTVTSEITQREYIMKFDRPTYVEPVIVVEYLPLAGFPQNGEQLIIDALVTQVYGIGETLVYSRLYTPINTVPGVQIESLTVNAGAANITADGDEKIRLLAANITVTDVTP